MWVTGQAVNTDPTAEGGRRGGKGEGRGEEGGEEGRGEGGGERRDEDSFPSSPCSAGGIRTHSLEDRVPTAEKAVEAK